MTAGDLQSGVSVTGNAITGTLKYQFDATKQLIEDFGKGYFLAVKFSDFSDGLTYADVRVGIDDDLSPLDSDCNGVFKIEYPSEHRLKVVQSDGTHTLTQTFDLSGLELVIPTVDTIVPTTVTYDANPDGANHRDVVFSVFSPNGEAVSKLFAKLGDTPDPSTDAELPQTRDDTVLWTLDDGVITIKSIVFDDAAAGETMPVYALLTNGNAVEATIVVVDTTPFAITPSSLTFDKNPDGANYGEKELTVTPSTNETSIVDVLDDEGDSIPPEYQEQRVWSLGDARHSLHLTTAFFESDMPKIYVALQNGDRLEVTITYEDTRITP